MIRWIIVGLVIGFGICASGAWLAHCSYLDTRCNMGQLYHNGHVYTLTKVDMTAPQFRADNADYDCTIKDRWIGEGG
jgi:O-glycosyl hydrolase